MNTATDICDLTTATPISAAPESAWRDFYELIKPRMNLLILGTTTVGFSIAARTTADWTRLPNALLGTALCAASAAILNQYMEREYDGLMPRTAQRPLPTGRIAPVHALLLGIITGILGGLYLLLFVNWMTAMLGSATLLSYVLVYTPLKRVTTLNTIVGAIPKRGAADDGLDRRDRGTCSAGVGVIWHSFRLADSAFSGDRDAVSRGLSTGRI